MKYVLVTGGGGSGIGKTVAASSIGVILKACSLRVTFIKIDPYLNTDAGTISPAERGEVFVLNDGSEVHMDLGDYERFLDVELTGDNNITAGKIYRFVIDKERRGDYLGKTIQIVPHITDAIQEWIKRVAMIPVDGREGPPDVCIIELGGTIGDIESRPFTEALSQFSCRAGPKNFCLVHVSLVPVINVVGEQKTKPTQYSVRCLRDLGLAPDLLACRSTTPLNKNVKEKLSQFCNVPVECIITLHDIPNIWHLPSLLKDQKGHEAILKMLGLACLAIEPKLDEWMERTTCEHLHDPVKIAVVGEHPYHANAYHSVFEAIRHASVACQRRLVVNWFPASDVVQETAESPDLHDKAWSLLKCADGVLVPGGFGHVEGKILAAKYARENNVPYLGICLGMQVAVIEFARSNLGLKDANIGELDAGTRHPCLILMPESSETLMRVGTKRTFFRTTDCKAARLYGNAKYVDERQRQRYMVNPEMVDKLESAGVSFVGMDETGQRMEILELPSHPYFVGVQFHPEFKSRPGKPSPLFMGLIAASSGQLDTESTSLGLGNRPIPMKLVLSGSSFGYPSGRKDGLLGLHSSGAALAR
ncbi:uncharacterized protein [Miscanthus floridulus]|uniref:uncharacterized protein n=1 Tax=Miscanthus floridulus TaxID=154761 RepID=UPI00345A5B67